MGDDLTPVNFIDKIKAMESRERNKLSAKKLIELICQTNISTSVHTEVAELRVSIEHINQIASTNKTIIESLTAKNHEYFKANGKLSAEVELLKIHAQECALSRSHAHPPAPLPPPNNNPEIENIRKEIIEIQEEINSIQQYLRVNNLEVVGLPEPNRGESEETLLINAINQLEGLNDPIRPEDVDISHPLNSQRKDGKAVHVVRFVSRKTKNIILDLKKKEENRQFRFRDRDVFINEHLSKKNRALFAGAQEKKRQLQYKFCWTRGGVVNMRKLETSPIVTITKNSEITKNCHAYHDIFRV